MTEKRHHISLILNETMYRGLKTLVNRAADADPFGRRLTQSDYLRNLIAEALVAGNVDD